MPYSIADIDQMLADMGVVVTFSTEPDSVGLLDAPSEIDLEAVSNAGIVGSAVVVTIKAGTLSGVTEGSAITAEGNSYVVRAVLASDDAAVQRLLCSSGTAAQLLSGADLRAQPIAPIPLPFDPAAAAEGVGGSGDAYFSQSEIKLMLADMGVPVATATDATMGLVDPPEEIDLQALGDMAGVVGAAIVITIETGTLPGITVNSTIAAAGIPYTVRAPLQDDDGAITRLLCTAGSDATPDPAPTGPLVIAHATQHDTLGKDPITTLDAGVIKSGLLALTRGGTNADLSAATALRLVRLNAAQTALEDAGVTVDELATDAEVTAAIAIHAGLPSVHHARYTDAEAVTALAPHTTDASAHHTRYADAEAQAVADTQIATHAALASAHHAKYTNPEAVAAMGVLADGNPLNHARYTDPDAVAALAPHTTDASAHHARYADTEAVTAMGVKADANALNHDRYTDAEAIAAVGSPGGDVFGPASATDNAIARYDLATGKLIQDSLVTVNDAGNISLPAAATVDGRELSTDGAKLDGIAASATANPNALDNLVEDLTPQLGGDLDGLGKEVNNALLGATTAAAARVTTLEASDKITATGQVVSVGNIEHDATDISLGGVFFALPIGTSSFARLLNSGTYDISGIANGVDGRVVTIIAEAPLQVIYAHEDPAVAASDRIDTIIGVDLVKGLGSSTSFRYNGASSRWEYLQHGTHGLYEDSLPTLNADLNGQGHSADNLIIGATTPKAGSFQKLNTEATSDANYSFRTWRDNGSFNDIQRVTYHGSYKSTDNNWHTALNVAPAWPGPVGGVLHIRSFITAHMLNTTTEVIKSWSRESLLKRIESGAQTGWLNLVNETSPVVMQSSTVANVWTIRVNPFIAQVRLDIKGNTSLNIRWHVTAYFQWHTD